MLLVTASWHIVGDAHDEAGFNGLDFNVCCLFSETTGRVNVYLQGQIHDWHMLMRQKGNFSGSTPEMVHLYLFINNKAIEKKELEALTATEAEPTLPVPSSSCSDSDWNTKSEECYSEVTKSWALIKVNYCFSHNTPTTWFEITGHTLFHTLVTLLWCFPAGEMWPKGVRQIDR